jgi:hypothetical protein
VKRTKRERPAWWPAFVLAAAVPDFPVWDLGGLLGNTLWGLLVIALGVAVLRSPARRPAATAVPVPGDTRSYPS